MERKARGCNERLPTLTERLACRSPPSSMVVMHQHWCNLLFIHWEVPKEIIQALLPERLVVDTFEEKAYIGIVPFFMRGVRPIYFPSIPGISNFPELNLRTYVYDSQTGKPGVWFFSLDAYQYIAVQIARKMFSLPYFYSKIEYSISSAAQPLIEYKCSSFQNSNRQYDCLSSLQSKEASENIKLPATDSTEFRYQASDTKPFVADPGTLEFFLVERYILYSHCSKTDRLYIGFVHHCPYPLQSLEICELDSKLISWYSKLLSASIGERKPDHVLYSRHVNVNIYPISCIE